MGVKARTAKRKKPIAIIKFAFKNPQGLNHGTNSTEGQRNILIDCNGIAGNVRCAPGKGKQLLDSAISTKIQEPVLTMLSF